MKKYLVTIKRTGYAQYEVEAENEDQAEALAWEQYDSTDADNGCDNDIYDVEELDEGEEE